MKKALCLMLSALLCVALFAAFAVGTGAAEATVLVPKGERLDVLTKGAYIIKAGEYTVSDFNSGSFHSGSFPGSGVDLTIDTGATVTVNFLKNFETLHVLGTVIVKCEGTNLGTIHVGCGGKLKGAISGTSNNFIYDEHNFENGFCSVCGKDEHDTAKDEPTEIIPNGSLIINNKDDVIIPAGNYELFNLCIGDPDMPDASLTIAEDATVTVISGLTNNGTLHVLGTLITPPQTNNHGTLHVGCAGKIEGEIEGLGAVIRDSHELDNGFCKNCDYFDRTQHEHIFANGVCVCGAEEPSGFTLGDGSVWIIAVGVVMIVGGLVTIFVAKKKAKSK